jgi:hypothetical protein
MPSRFTASVRADVLVVVERRERADERERVHVERLAHAPMASITARARPRSRCAAREPVELRERAQRDDGTRPSPRARIVSGYSGSSTYSAYASSATTTSARGSAARNASHAARRKIVPVGLFGLARKTTASAASRLGDRLEVVREVAQRDDPARAAARLHHHAVDDERLVRHHRLVAGG